jgi:hypothetical protein
MTEIASNVIKGRWYPHETSSIKPFHGDYFEGTAVLDGDGYAVFYYLGSCSSIVNVKDLTDEDGNPIQEA